MSAVPNDCLAQKLMVSNNSSQVGSCKDETTEHVVVTGTCVRDPEPPTTQVHQPQQPHHQITIRSEKCAWSVTDAYLLCIPFAGFLGAHHFYLRRPKWGVAYLLTFGFLGWGILIDIFRLPCLVKRAQRDSEERHRAKLLNKQAPITKYDVGDGYVLAGPLGFLGLQHFYLGRSRWGVLYLLTFGLLGIGWIADLIRMPWLVEDANRRLECRSAAEQPDLEAGTTGQAGTATGTIPCALPVHSGAVMDSGSGITTSAGSPATPTPVSKSQPAHGMSK